MPGRSILGRHCHVHCPDRSTTPAEPRRFDKRPAAPNSGTEHLVRWDRPAGTRLEYPDQRPQDSAYPLCQFGRHTIRGIHRGVGETVDQLLYSEIGRAHV